MRPIWFAARVGSSSATSALGTTLSTFIGVCAAASALARPTAPAVNRDRDHRAIDIPPRSAAVTAAGCAFLVARQGREPQYRAMSEPAQLENPVQDRTAAMLELMGQARRRAAHDPFGSPVLAAALAIGRKMDTGELDLELVAEIVASLRDEAAEERACRLRDYVGGTGPGAA